MTIWLHSTILATSVAATIAVGIASAAKYDAAAAVAPKADLLPVAAAVAAPTPDFVTIEKRGDGVSVLARIPADDDAPVVD
ncbi:MAG: hypothetical protein J0H08_04345 [Rhizobiales bacterium]|nr:hypothetical protein [Hyphomicrobiales bacterium]